MELPLLNSCLVRIIWKFLEQIELPLIESALYMLGILYTLPQFFIITLRFYAHFMGEGTEAQRDNDHVTSLL